MTNLPFAEKLTYGPPAGFVPREWQENCQRALRVKFKAHASGQFTFLVCAGVGSGKTPLAAAIAADLLNRRVIRRVVFVCPNKVIKRASIRTFKEFGIHLADWNNQKYREGEPVVYQGAALTYQSLSIKPELHRRLCQTQTLVIFDEIHHLGDNLAWGQASRCAFDSDGVFVLGLSGTPYRTDNREIPFVTYLPQENGLRRFKADYAYSLGEAVNDGVCREPHFHFRNPTVEVDYGNERQIYDFNDTVSEDTANLILGGAVRPGSISRTDILAQAVQVCRTEARKLIIFVGGDSGSETLATEDASTMLPAELLKLGLQPGEFVAVTSDDKDAVRRLEEFGKSKAWVLITINMVSEGADIPELSAALFLTSITAKATTVQRIGRVLRGSGMALIFMFGDRRYVELSVEIKKEIEHEFRLRRSRPQEEDKGEPRFFRPLPEAIGVSSAPSGVTVNGKFYQQDQVDRAEATLRSKGLQCSYDLLAMALVLGGDQPPCQN